MQSQVGMEVFRSRENQCRALLYEFLSCGDPNQRKLIAEQYRFIRNIDHKHGDSTYSILKPISACYNDCKYCYIKPMFKRFRANKAGHPCGAASKSSELFPEVDYDKVNKGWSTKASKKIISFPSSHDIFPSIASDYILVCKKIIEAGHSVLCTTKPRLECIRKICGALASDKYKASIIFRFTIGSVDSNTLKHWEPNAPTFEERLECLKYAFERGFATSVSIEPMLDVRADSLIQTIKPYITETIWIGLMTQMPSADFEDTYYEKNKSNKLKYLFSILYKYQHDHTIMWKPSLVKFMLECGGGGAQQRAVPRDPLNTS